LLASNSYSTCVKIFWIIFDLRNEFIVIGSSKENLSSGTGLCMLKPSKGVSTFNSEMWIVQGVELPYKLKGMEETSKTSKAQDSNTFLRLWPSGLRFIKTGLLLLMSCTQLREKKTLDLNPQ